MAKPTTTMKTTRLLASLAALLATTGFAAPPPSYWDTNDATDGNLPESPDDFLAGATQNAGSWWTHWHQWVTSLPGGSTKVKARKPEDGALKVIEPAPGSYVKFRLDAQKKN